MCSTRSFHKTKSRLIYPPVRPVLALINFVNKNGSPLIAKPMEVSKSEDGDGTVTNVLRVVLLPEETVDLVGKFIYQITIQDISGEIEIPDQGIIRIANNINKSFPH